MDEPPALTELDTWVIGWRMSQLRLVKSTPDAFSYTNRMGQTYYLHEGKTKKGNPRYFFAKTVRAGARSEMPDGYEVSESVNGVVSVCRKQRATHSVPDEDVELVRSAVGVRGRLRHYAVRRVRNAIVIFEPGKHIGDLRAIEKDLGCRLPSCLSDRIEQARYAPVMKFEPADRGYEVCRMTYRGEGGWSWPLATGKLEELVRRFVGPIGTDRFFDLV